MASRVIRFLGMGMANPDERWTVCPDSWKIYDPWTIYDSGSLLAYNMTWFNAAMKEMRPVRQRSLIHTRDDCYAVVSLPSTGNPTTGTARAGGADTIQLAVGESAANGYYNYMVIEITDGAASGQIRRITDYTGATRTATVTPAWDVGDTPDATSVYNIYSAALLTGSELYMDPADASALEVGPCANVRVVRVVVPGGYNTADATTLLEDALQPFQWLERQGHVVAASVAGGTDSTGSVFVNVYAGDFALERPFVIIDVDQVNDYFTVDGDFEEWFPAGALVYVAHSSANDDEYTVDHTALSGGDTDVYVTEEIPSATVDGYLYSPLGFKVAGAGTFESSLFGGRVVRHSELARLLLSAALEVAVTNGSGTAGDAEDLTVEVLVVLE